MSLIKAQLLQRPAFNIFQNLFHPIQPNMKKFLRKLKHKAICVSLMKRSKHPTHPHHHHNFFVAFDFNSPCNVLLLLYHGYLFFSLFRKIILLYFPSLVLSKGTFWKLQTRCISKDVFACIKDISLLENLFSDSFLDRRRCGGSGRRRDT